MEVTIQKRVNFEEVPSEIKAMLRRVSSLIFVLHEVSQVSLEHDGISDIMMKDVQDMLDKVREIDLSLEDVDGIMKGYLNAISQQQEKELGELKDDNVDRSKEGVQGQ